MTNLYINKLASETMEESCSLDEAVIKYKLSRDFILKLIEKGYIKGYDMSSHGMGYMILPNSAFKLKVISENEEYKTRVFNINPSYISDFNPYLISYLEFHDFLDRFCWILKLNYSEKEDIKKRKYRIDVLLQRYLKENKIVLSKLEYSQVNSFDKVIFHLQKGWYNEMVRSTPLSDDWLNIGTKITGSVANSSAISWNIIQTYYSVYEYTNTVVFCNSQPFDTSQHKKSIKVFNENILGKVNGTLICFPFNISSRSSFKSQTIARHLQFMYSRYPRDFNKNILDLAEDIKSHYISINTLNNTFINFMYEFRVWANYTGIETILSLENGYLLSFLFKNLSTINFFSASFAELNALAVIGEKEYFYVLENFSNKYLFQQPAYTNTYLIPIFIRMRIYHHLGYIKDLPRFCLPKEVDPIKFL